MSDNLARRPTTALDVEKAIQFRIATGTYSANGRIPTCEQLGAELGINKNTVSKAYRALAARGYLRTVPGRGTFVVKRRAKLNPESATGEVGRLLALAVQEAKLGGLQREQFERLVVETTARYYTPTTVRVGFVECNEHDAAMLSRDLQSSIAHPITPLLLDHVTAQPRRYANEYDVLAVNLVHLMALESALAEVREPGRAEVVALHVPPDPTTLIEVARLRPGTTLAIVCDLPGTLNTLRGMASGSNASLVIVGALTTDPAELRRAVRQADVILVTPSACDDLLALEPSAPLISVTFQIDDVSVKDLGRRVEARLEVAASVKQ